jgi:hypothetical protein
LFRMLDKRLYLTDALQPKYQIPPYSTISI